MRATALSFAVDYAGVLTEHDEGTMSPEDIVAMADVFLQFLTAGDSAPQTMPATDPNSVPSSPDEIAAPEPTAAPVELPPPVPPPPPEAPVPEQPAPVA